MEEQENSIKKIKTLYKSGEKVIKLFNDYSKTVPEAKYKTTYGDRLKILKAGNTSENLPKEIKQITCSLYRAKEITKKVYNNIMNSLKV